MPALYETTVKTTGGRQGHAESTDGQLKVDLAMPKALGGSGKGTNPEQLFAAGYSACFEGAMRFLARRDKVPVGDIHVDGTVGLHQPDPNAGFKLEVALAITTTGLSQAEAEKLVHDAHQACPYSNAVRGNIDVQLNVTANA